MRTLTGLLIAAACLVSAPAVAAQSPLASPDARVFTVAGGGSVAPRDGIAATDADFGYVDVAGLPDGTVALTDRRASYVVGKDGILHALPSVRADGRSMRASLLGRAADGGLLGMPIRGRTVYSLKQGASSWSPLASIKALPKWQFAEVYDLVGVPGAVVVATSEGVWRVALDDSSAARLRPETQDDVENLATQQLAGFPDGTIGFTYSDNDEVAIAAPGGAVRTLVQRAQPGDVASVGLTALPDGTLARAAGSVDVLGLNGALSARLGERPAFGTGDGGSPMSAFLGGSELAAAGAALLLVQDPQVGIDHAPFDMGARQWRNGALTFPVPDVWYPHYVVRMIVPGAADRALAALTPGTYATLAAGRVTYQSTFAGHARITIRKQGRIVAASNADVSAGAGELQLSAIPPVGNLRVHLDMRGAAGERATSRMTVVTRKRLMRDRALRLLRTVPENAPNLGFFFGWDAGRVRHCKRWSAVEFRCDVLFFRSAGGATREICPQAVIARLRPDGLRGWINGRRSDCRSAK